MPKMKTKSSVKKRFKLTGTGKVKRKQAFTSHMMMNKSNKQKRDLRGTTIMADCDAKVVLKSWMPYARKRKKQQQANQEG